MRDLQLQPFTTIDAISQDCCKTIAESGQLVMQSSIVAENSRQTNKQMLLEIKRTKQFLEIRAK